MKTIQEMIEVMQGYDEGKEIEFYDYSSCRWKTIPEPCWDWHNSDYRIKPEKKEPTYRPYESTDEMIEDFCMRFDSEYYGESEMPLIWIKAKNNNSQTHLITSFGTTYVEFASGNTQRDNLFDYYTYLDGTPIGKLVEEEEEE